MTSVKKCDICGITYEGGKSRWLGGVSTSYVNITDYGDYAKDCAYEHKLYETCPCCTKTVKDFIKFMKKQKEKKAPSDICRRGLFRRRNVPQGFFVYEYPF